MIKLVHTTALIALAGLIVLTPGCSGSDDSEKRAGPPPPPPQPPRADTLRDCATRIEGRRLRPGPHDVVAGPIVFFGLRAAARQPPSDYRDRGRGRYASFKTVTQVEANAVVTLAVPEGEQDLALNFEHERLPAVAQLSELQRAVQFRACDRSEPSLSPGGGPVGPRTQFNGGFAPAGPGCRSIDVFPQPGAEPIRLSVGFGTGRRDC
jgi:hypothetical protein